MSGNPAKASKSNRRSSILKVRQSVVQESTSDGKQRRVSFHSMKTVQTFNKESQDLSQSPIREPVKYDANSTNSDQSSTILASLQTPRAEESTMMLFRGTMCRDPAPFDIHQDTVDMSISMGIVPEDEATKNRNTEDDNPSDNDLTINVFAPRAGRHKVRQSLIEPTEPSTIPEEEVDSTDAAWSTIACFRKAHDGSDMSMSIMPEERAASPDDANDTMAVFRRAPPSVPFVPPPMEGSPAVSCSSDDTLAVFGKCRGAFAKMENTVYGDSPMDISTMNKTTSKTVPMDESLPAAESGDRTFTMDNAPETENENMNADETLKEHSVRLHEELDVSPVDENFQRVRLDTLVEISEGPNSWERTKSQTVKENVSSNGSQSSKNNETSRRSQSMKAEETMDIENLNENQRKEDSVAIERAETNNSFYQKEESLGMFNGVTILREETREHQTMREEANSLLGLSSMKVASMEDVEMHPSEGRTPREDSERESAGRSVSHVNNVQSTMSTQLIEDERKMLHYSEMNRSVGLDGTMLADIQPPASIFDAIQSPAFRGAKSSMLPPKSPSFLRSLLDHSLSKRYSMDTSSRSSGDDTLTRRFLTAEERASTIHYLTISTGSREVAEVFEKAKEQLGKYVDEKHEKYRQSANEAVAILEASPETHQLAKAIRAMNPRQLRGAQQDCISEGKNAAERDWYEKRKQVAANTIKQLQEMIAGVHRQQEEADRLNREVEEKKHLKEEYERVRDECELLRDVDVEEVKLLYPQVLEKQRDLEQKRALEWEKRREKMAAMKGYFIGRMAEIRMQTQMIAEREEQKRKKKEQLLEVLRNVNIFAEHP